jgi:ABC-type transport system involved in multi-copper enzyme maturation permease subunit
MKEADVLKRVDRLLFGVPVIVIGLGIVAGVLSLFNIRDENIAYVVGAIVCVIAIFGLVHYALGAAAKLFGSSWVLFGLLPVLFIPFGQLASWAVLLDKRMKLKKQLEQSGARA